MVNNGLSFYHMADMVLTFLQILSHLLLIKIFDVELFILFNRWENWGRETLNNQPNISFQINIWARTWNKSSDSRLTLFRTMLYYSYYTGGLGMCQNILTSWRKQSPTTGTLIYEGE